jgi:uncharacterized protein
MSNSATVRENKGEKRFEMPLEGGKMALIQYVDAGEGVIALVHTEVPEEFEGKGIGARLVKESLEIIKQDDRRIIPTCPFISTYLKRHPEYQSLVNSEL